MNEGLARGDGALRENWPVAPQGHDAHNADFLACATALSNVHSFLHGEVPEEQADQIRAHLMACESCMDDFDVEATITSMLKRCFPPTTATATLKVRIQALHIALVDGFRRNG